MEWRGGETPSGGSQESPQTPPAFPPGRPLEIPLEFEPEMYISTSYRAFRKNTKSRAPFLSSGATCVIFQEMVPSISYFFGMLCTRCQVFLSQKWSHFGRLLVWGKRHGQGQPSWGIWIMSTSCRAFPKNTKSRAPFLSSGATCAIFPRMVPSILYFLGMLYTRCTEFYPKSGAFWEG